MATATLGIPPGASFAYEVGTRIIDGQLRHSDALDTKAGIVLAVDGVLAGLLFGNTPYGGQLVDLPVLAGAVGLLLSFLLGLLAFGTRRYRTAPALDVVVGRMARGEDWLKWRVLGNLLQAVTSTGVALT